MGVTKLACKKSLKKTVRAPFSSGESVDRELELRRQRARTMLSQENRFIYSPEFEGMERSTAPLKAADRLLEELSCGDPDKKPRLKSDAADDETVVFLNWSSSDPLLSFEQEQVLFLALNLARYRINRLRSRLSAETPDVRIMNQIEQKLELVEKILSDGRTIHSAKLDPEILTQLKSYSLLTAKPVLYAANVTEDELASGEGPHVKALRKAVEAGGEPAEIVPFSAKIEAELSELGHEERVEFLASLGIESAGLDRLIRAAYHLLGLQTYFTAGEKEVRAWTIHHGDTAPKAAAVIHSDFERGFIRAETVAFGDFMAYQGWKGAREKGLVRSEGKEYVVNDGDVMLFRFNV